MVHYSKAFARSIKCSWAIILQLAESVEPRRSTLKKLVTVLLLSIAVLTFAFSRPALAGDAIIGSKIFSANCAACHLGGSNVIMANKTLKKEALEKYKMNSLKAITNQVKKGKNAMPAFGGRLSDRQIEDVATYVLQQAKKGW